MTSTVWVLAWLTAVWLALWGEPSVANVLSGVVVAGALLWLFPRRTLAGSVRIHPLPAVRFAGFFLWKLIAANAVVAWEVVTPNNERVREGVVRVDLEPMPDSLVTLVANAVSLTPGTLTLEVSGGSHGAGRGSTLFVHVLHLYDAEEVRRDVRRLAELAAAALRPASLPEPAAGEEVAP